MRPAETSLSHRRVAAEGFTASPSATENIRRAAAQRGTSLHLRAPTRPVPARALHLAGLDHLCDIASPTTDTDRPPEHRPDSHPQAPRPRLAPSTDTAPSVESTVDTDPDEYAHLIPVQRRYVQLPAEDPHRRRLRDHLICGYRPVAHHLARRFAAAVNHSRTSSRSPPSD